MPKPPPLILLVEDEPDLREVIIDVIEIAGFRIEVAGNYADGVALLNASRPALLIANVVLPAGGDGYKLAQAARRLGVPTLLVSGYPEEIVGAEARKVPFLTKPFGLTELKRMVRTLIERAPAVTKPDLPFIIQPICEVG